MEPPPRWREMVDNIRRVRQKYPAPVDTMGCAKANVLKDATERFRILVSLMLSSQTKDPVTWAAVERLRSANLCNVGALKEASEKEIEDLIHPVGFYRRKAIYLKKVAQILDKDYARDIPQTVEDLCALPGVGPKMAHLCMNEAWETVTGIGVDTHVHRIAARLGWVPTKGIKTPEDTRKALESWMPRDHWREINLLLVGFGQTICTPLRPKCSECFNNVICPSSSVRGKGTNLKITEADSGVTGAKFSLPKIKIEWLTPAEEPVADTIDVKPAFGEPQELPKLAERKQLKRIRKQPDIKVEQVEQITSEEPPQELFMPTRLRKRAKKEN